MKMSTFKKALASGMALTLLFSQGALIENAEAKGKKETKVVDKNKNGIADDWEKKYKLKGKNIEKQDNDKDGLTNKFEYKLKLNPKSKDSDKDKIQDSLEDTDKDSLKNEVEIELQLDPADADTDNDGVKDGNEDPDKDGVKVANEVRAFKVKVKLQSKKTIDVDYKILKSKVSIKVKDKTGNVTVEMVENLVNDLHAASGLTKDQIIEKIQTTFNIDESYDIEVKIKYYKGKEMEIEREVEVDEEEQADVEEQEDQDDQEQEEDEQEDQGEEDQSEENEQ